MRVIRRTLLRRRVVGMLLFLVSVGALVPLVAAGSHDETVPRDRLPDLDQETPSELGVRTALVDGRTDFMLGFQSAVRNVGDGPLIVDATRPDASTPTMEADQIVTRRSAAPRRIKAIGHFRYVVAPTHRHWHYLHFDRYELRRVGSHEIVSDRKSGFCLGDRYSIPRPLAAAPPTPVHTGRCGLDQPQLLQMKEGTSVGYGDNYPGFVEGQELPLSGLPGGRYLLVHRVNGNRELAETSYVNNAASVLLDLSWVRGAPVVRILAECADSARCSESAQTAAAGRADRLASSPISQNAKAFYCRFAVPV
jgi:Lysyl oxidase